MKTCVMMTERNGSISAVGLNPQRGTGSMACVTLMVVAFTILSAQAATYYVSENGNNGDGLSWVNAKRTIQLAIDQAVADNASAGSEIIVTNGVYAPITTANRDIKITSVNGAAVTIIDGQGLNRCATLGRVPIYTSDTNTILTGFSLQNGYSIGSGGGGSWGGTLNNCTLTGNTANNGTGGGSYYSNLNDCTLTGNTATGPTYGGGGGAYNGTLNNCTLTGNSAESGGGSYYSNLNNCILSGNTASSSGGGSFDGKLNNCTVTGNTATTFGGGSNRGTLNNCTLSGNSATFGGGSIYGTLNNCTLSGNTAGSGGGGAYDSTLNNCTLSNNTADTGGGAHGCTLSNCLLTGNTADNGRGGGAYGGALNNCTLVGNTALGGGGSANGTLNNCIVWGNFLMVRGSDDNYYGSTFTNSCTMPMPSSGVGNIAADPLFRLPEAGDFRLLAGSPCIDAGSNSYTNGTTDILGNPRVQNGTVDMGAYEGTGTLLGDTAHVVQNLQATTDRTDGILVSWDPPSAGGSVLYRVCRLSTATGKKEQISGWITEMTLLDTQVYGGIDYIYVVVAAFDVQLDAISVLSPPVTGSRVYAPSWYVSTSGDDNAVGISWGTAKRTIQAAIDLAGEYDTIVVTNGIYTPISTANKSIIIRSVHGTNGAPVTIIDGGNTNRCATFGTDPLAKRCGNTILTGFTLWNGNASHVNVTIWRNCGGGSAGGILNNCTLTGNTAIGNPSQYGGGGAYYGTLNNCTLTNNTASRGGGAFACTLNNCILSDNIATDIGGGSSDGTLNNCVLMNNTSTTFGGGSAFGMLYNCMLSGNTASSGGGAWDSMLNNCTLTGNTASTGGGVFRGPNTCILNNCIVWGNFTTSGAANNYANSSGYPITFRNSCTTPLPSRSSDEGGNIAQTPLFVNVANGDYRLQTGSPCIDTGNNDYVDWAFDLDGNLRIQNGTVDMGAYESSPASYGITISQSGTYTFPAATYGYGTQTALTVGVTNVGTVATGILDLLLSGTDAGSFEFSGGATVSSIAADGNSSFTVRPKTGLAAGTYTATVSIGNANVPAKTFNVSFTVNPVTTTTCYVSTNGNDSAIGTSWATAKKTIQAAVDAVVAGGTVIVTNGVYAPISTANKAITISSVNGANYTIIDGNNATRCATLGSDWTYNHTNTVLIGFMLRNGFVNANGNGGGALGGTLNNCLLTSNTAEFGGGARYSILNNCTISGNTAKDGGGVRDSILYDCTLTGNTAYKVQQGNTGSGGVGGGSCGGTLYNCTLSDNTAESSGGGAFSGTLHNCILLGNMAYSRGGGAYHSTLNNCLLEDNTALYGGGADSGTLNNCTLIGNTAAYSGGGVHCMNFKGDGSGELSDPISLNNCIVWGNSATLGANYNGNYTFSYSCTTPLPTGMGNIEADPLFVDAANGDYRLLEGSPCIDAGSNDYVYWDDDLDGNPRIMNGTVDMGVYEFQFVAYPITYTVTYNGNGNTGGATASSTHTYDTPKNLTLNGFERTGYTFAGWATNALDVVVYADGQNVINLTPANGATVTLYAKWTPITYTVTYNGNGNTGGATASSTHTYDTPKNLTLNGFERTGYTFAGWATNALDVAVYADGQNVINLTPANGTTVTLYAKWTPITYTVTYNGNGNTGGATASSTHTYDTPKNLTLNGFERTGYTFAGWATNALGVAVYADGQNVINLTPANGTTVTLYACWSDDPILFHDPYLSGTDETDDSPALITTAFEGFAYDDGNTVRGTVTLKATAKVKLDKKTGIATTNWTFSAKAVLQGASVSFSGKLTGAADRFAVTNKTDALDVTVSEDRFFGTLSGVKSGGTFHVDGARNAFADKTTKAAAQARQDPVLGLYNVALPDGDGSPGHPSSMGYLALSAGKNGAVKIAGSLGDGTKVSGSAKLLEGLNGDGWYAIALHRPLYSKKGFVGALLWLDPLDKMILVDTDYGWRVDWVRDTDPKKPGEEFARELDVMGGRFGDGKLAPPVSGGLVFGAGVPEDLPVPVADLTGVWVDAAFPWGLEVVYGANGKLSLAKGAAPKRPKGEAAYDYSGLNPSCATLSYTAKTGVFKGKFSLYYDGTDARGALQHKTVSVPYSGVMVPLDGGLTGLGTGTATVNKRKFPIPVYLAK